MSQKDLVFNAIIRDYPAYSSIQQVIGASIGIGSLMSLPQIASTVDDNYVFLPQLAEFYQNNKEVIVDFLSQTAGLFGGVMGGVVGNGLDRLLELSDRSGELYALQWIFTGGFVQRDEKRPRPLFAKKVQYVDDLSSLDSFERGKYVAIRLNGENVTRKEADDLLVVIGGYTFRHSGNNPSQIRQYQLSLENERYVVARKSSDDEFTVEAFGKIDVSRKRLPSLIDRLLDF